MIYLNWYAILPTLLSIHPSIDLSTYILHYPAMEDGRCIQLPRGSLHLGLQLPDSPWRRELAAAWPFKPRSNRSPFIRIKHISIKQC
jgi:hypothetical protein